jgi:uncharacterized damage-inducible protein DinB
MFSLLSDLIAHKNHANTILLDAIREHPDAGSDPEVLALLRHILVANRFWFQTCSGQPFVVEPAPEPDSLEALTTEYRSLREQEEAWIAGATDDDLTRMLESQLIPGGRCSVAEGLAQVCLHSHGHRAQCAKLLRRLGATVPMTDFILWLANRSSR